MPLAQTRSNKRSLKFFFFGDSICFGQGVSIHHGWVPRISGELEKHGKKAGFDILLSNASVNGNTTRLALERMPYDVQSHRPDRVIVQFGMNDCNYWKSDEGHPRVSREAFAANLHEIIARSLTFGAREVFVNTNHPTSRSVEVMPFTQLTYQRSNEAYNEAIREVAKRFDKVRLIDIEKIFFEEIKKGRYKLEELLLEDGLHLSLRGHDLYFESISPNIVESLDRE